MDREAKKRLSWVRQLSATGDAGLVCQRRGISRPTLQKWLRRYREEGAKGLQPLNRRPASSPAKKVLPEQEGWILDLRRKQGLRVVTATGILWM